MAGGEKQGRKWKEEWKWGLKKKPSGMSKTGKEPSGTRKAGRAWTEE